ncbi:uncharacterized protein METZ01_LOCUS26329 [marine metagenome]|uniref:Uncharacterized protein n=1 Tax=marine metagenome TaxID=408172 RepID=A0A381Q2A8_9ZZZZ
MSLASSTAIWPDAMIQCRRGDFSLSRATISAGTITFYRRAEYVGS